MPDREGTSDARLEQLALTAATGDPVAIEEFLRTVQGPVVRFCRTKLIGSSGILTADDVAQDVLYALCQALPRYRVESCSVMAFVFGIARHKIVDAFRAARRDSSSPSDSLPDSPDDGPDPESLALLGAETERVKAALAQLPDHHREVFVLRVALSYTAAEVAEIVGATPGSVRVTQHRALTKLKQLLAGTTHDGEAG